MEDSKLARVRKIRVNGHMLHPGKSWPSPSMPVWGLQAAWQHLTRPKYVEGKDLGRNVIGYPGL